MVLQLCESGETVKAAPDQGAGRRRALVCHVGSNPASHTNSTRLSSMARTPVCGAGYDSSILSFGTNSLLFRLAVGRRPLTPVTVVRIHEEQPLWGNGEMGTPWSAKPL